uniref:BTB domain-containing protein n=1 Tax=Acrobeloides nanus TaxID=290746 RepID=A0A914DNU5_9BILA
MENSGVILDTFDIFHLDNDKIDGKTLFRSTAVKIGGFSWYIKIKYESPRILTKFVPYIGIFLCSEQYDIEWSSNVTCEFCLISSKTGQSFADIKSENQTFSHENPTKGISQFCKWNEIEAHAKEGKITVKVDILVNRSCGVYLIKNNMPQANVRIIVDGNTFYANKEYLMVYSNYFKSAFLNDFKEKQENSIELKSISAQSFDQLLQFICPQRSPITEHNIEEILKLADYFDMPYVLHQCGKFLGESNSMDVIKSLKLANEYKLFFCVKAIILNSTITIQHFDKTIYKEFKPETKAAIFDGLCCKNEENSESRLEKCAGLKMNFHKKNESADEIELIIDGVSFFVNKVLLSTYSDYFKTQFYEIDVQTVLIDEVEVVAHDFYVLLTVIYPTHEPITKDNVVQLLELTRTFQMPDVTRYCETYLQHEDAFDFFELLKLADKFSLTKLLDHLLNNIDLVKIREFRHRLSAAGLSEKVELQVYKRLLDKLLFVVPKQYID